MISPALSVVTLAGSPQAAQANEARGVSEVEYDMLLALLSSAKTQRAVHQSMMQHRPWNAPEAKLEPVTGYDPRG